MANPQPTAAAHFPSPSFYISIFYIPMTIGSEGPA